MQPFPTYPVVYEINTWVWLAELSRQAGKPITLRDVPQGELERIAGYGFDGVWLMGVWQRSPGARQVARTYPGWQTAFQEALPDYSEVDIPGSPYAIHDYWTDLSLGGEDGLMALRSRLSEFGLSLMLDFVPNHMALDHIWLKKYPERFVQGSQQQLKAEPANYFQHPGGAIFAHGRDPYFDGWPDTVQLDYRLLVTRRVMSDALLRIAERCDGVRCDMAMLLTREVFQRTWGGQFNPPQAEFWPTAIADLKASHPDF
jgi:glycosidase